VAFLAYSELEAVRFIDMNPMAGTWQSTQKLGGTRYVCGFCNHTVASENGWFASGVNNSIRICPSCERPTFFEGGTQTPGIAFGDEVKALPKELAALYAERGAVVRSTPSLALFSVAENCS
jgi:hypothetical protein